MCRIIYSSSVDDDEYILAFGNGFSGNSPSPVWFFSFPELLVSNGCFVMEEQSHQRATICEGALNDCYAIVDDYGLVSG